MNLSDIFEYLSPDDSDKLFSLLSQHTVKGGRLIYWVLYSDRYPPLDGSIKFLKDLSQELLTLSRSFFFKPCVLESV